MYRAAYSNETLGRPHSSAVLDRSSAAEVLGRFELLSSFL